MVRSSRNSAESFRLAHRVSRFRCSLLALAPLVCSSYSVAQQPVQTGRLFDRNPQLGGGGLNSERPYTPLLSGNAIASGDVGRGFSFRGLSGISSANTLRAPLGSAYLSDFRRDSVSVADSTSPDFGLTPRLFYDPSRTAFTPRFLGVQQPPTQGLSTYQSQGADQSAILGFPTQRGGLNSPIGAAPLANQNYATPAANDALRAQINGISPANGDDPRGALLNTQPRILPDRPDAARSPLSTPVQKTSREPMDARIDNRQLDNGAKLAINAEPLARPLDLILGGADSAALLGSRHDNLLANTGSTSISRMDSRPTPINATRTASFADRAVTPENRPGLPVGKLDVVPGRDVFTDMQLALSLSRDSNAGWFRELQTTARQDAALKAEMGDVAAMESDKFVNSVLQSPIHTFVGHGASGVNEALSQAEAMLGTKHFYDATLQYDRARAIDPNNPLPLIGKGHAQLAAGEYQSAANSILAGLQRFPELSRMNVDIKGFIGGEAVDIRRSDLMKRLETREEPTLRFLLGYLEYYSGIRDSGLENLRKAAKSADPGSIIQRYPDMLSGHGSLPPPRLPLSTETAPNGPTSPTTPRLLQPGDAPAKKKSKP